MLLFKTRKELNAHLTASNNQRSLGLVPTMGALHEGHLALVQKAVLENEVVVISIFVNPTQFNNEEDLVKYPKTLDTDMALLKKVSNDLIVFVPTVGEMYPSQVKSSSYDFGRLEHVMEGAFREGHFDGVGTIVEALLNLVKPDNAYFGEKDYQQLQIIKKLVSLKKIPVTIIGCPIIREANGLALSSRNERLSKTDREEAAFIYSTLKAAKKRFGTESALKVKGWVSRQYLGNPNLKLEYFEISEARTLRPMTRKRKNKKYRAFIAVYIAGVRLIDNIALN